MIENIITGLKIAGISLLLGVCYYFYNNYSNLKEELATTQSNLKVSEQNNETLKNLAKDNANTIEKLQQDSRFIRTVNNELIQKNNEYNSSIQELKSKLERSEKDGKKTLDELATKKPQRIQKVLNMGTHKMKICLEKESGAKGEEYEKTDCK